MIEPDSSSQMVVLDSAAAATFVTAARSSRYFLPFLGRERFPAEVARELGVDIGAVTYRITQMLRLGLVQNTRTVPRAGRSMRAYRARWDAVFAPMELTPVSTISALFEQTRIPSEETLRHAIERAWRVVGRDGTWGTHLYRPSELAEINRDFVPLHMARTASFWKATLAEGAPAVWDQLTTIALSPRAAKNLQRDLAALVQRHSTDDPGSEGRVHIVHLAMAPVERTQVS